jgi:hypothetical protein
MKIRGALALLAFIPVAALLAADSAERPVAMAWPIDRETHDTVKALIRSLNAETYGEREMATRQLIEKDQAALPDLKATLNKCENPEVCSRLKKIIAAIQEVSFLGTFDQCTHEVESGGGIRQEENINSQLVVEKGRVVWKQDYQGRALKQYYTFDEKTTTFKGDGEVKLKFVKMVNGGAGYSAESKSPRLILKNSAHGVLVTFMATDSYNQTSTVQFSESATELKIEALEKEDKDKKEDPKEEEVDVMQIDD